MLEPDEPSKSKGPWLREFQSRPLEFSREVLGRKTYKGLHSLWHFQEHILKNVEAGKDTVTISCRKTGKSEVAGGVVTPYFFATRPARVLILAPTLHQIRDVLWPKLDAGYRSKTHVLPGSMTRTRLEVDPEHYVTALPTNSPSRIRGYHSGVEIGGDPNEDYLTPEDLQQIIDDPEQRATPLLIIVDEPQGIAPEIFDAMGGVTRGPLVTQLWNGNPFLGIDDEHPYVRNASPDSKWSTLRVSTMSVEDERELGVREDPWLESYEGFYRVPYKFSPKEDIAEALKQYEATDPIFMSDFLGRFAFGSTSMQVVPRIALEAALIIRQGWQNDVKEEGGRSQHIPQIGPRIGVDIGTGNPDPCAASLFVDGEKVDEEEWAPESDDKRARVTIARHIAELAVRWGKMVEMMYPGRWDGSPIVGERLSVDDTGNEGVCDIMFEHGLDCDRVNFSAPSQGHYPELVGTQRCLNVRAEMYWVARRGLQTGHFVIPQRFSKSWKQLPWTLFERKSDSLGSIIQLEEKVKVKGRHKRSPDMADADVLAMRETRPSFTIAQAGGPVVAVPAMTLENQEAMNRHRTRPKFTQGWTPL